MYIYDADLFTVGCSVLNSYHVLVVKLRISFSTSFLLYLSCSEEQDFEFARVIQEEIQRCAEETRRREQDDEVRTNSYTPSHTARI